MGLVAAAKAGSTSAFTELYRAYSKNILRKTYAITQNREDAEDALQDSFLKAFACIEQFQGNAQFYSWLMRIAINSSLMVLRKRRLRRELPIEVSTGPEDSYAIVEVQDAQPDPEQRYDQAQRYRNIVRSIDRLPPKLRVVAEMRLLRGLSVGETGNKLGITETAIKARLFRARTRIAAHQTALRRERRNCGAASNREPLLAN